MTIRFAHLGKNEASLIIPEVFVIIFKRVPAAGIHEDRTCFSDTKFVDFFQTPLVEMDKKKKNKNNTNKCNVLLLTTLRRS